MDMPHPQDEARSHPGDPAAAASTPKGRSCGPSPLGSLKRATCVAYPAPSPASVAWTRAWSSETALAPSPRSSRGKRGPGSSRARARLKESNQRGLRLRVSGTIQAAGRLRVAATTSCRGMRTPRRRKRRRMAPQDEATHATSCRSSSFAPADEASRHRWDRRQCQLVSRSVFPKDRHVGRRICIPSWPQARRKRAMGHFRGDPSSASTVASSLEV